MNFMISASNLTYIVFFILITSSCKENASKVIEGKKQHAEKNILINDTLEKPIYALIKKAITNGDTIAYSDASSFYFHEGSEAEFLHTALIMANKYDYSRAYYEVYTTLVYSHSNETVETLDPDTKCLALYYLLKAKEKGDARAIGECETIFKGKEIPKSNFYLLEMAKN